MSDVRPRAEVLVVDDRPEQRLSLSAVLDELDVGVVEAESGRDALRWLLQRDFAVILLDVNMPGMDGFETAAMIRGRRRSENTPILFITSYGDDTHAARGYSLGAVDYILAPVDPQVLRTKVGVFVDLYRRAQEATHHAQSERRRTEQLQRMAEASLAIHTAASVAELLKIVGDTATALIGAEQVAIRAALEPDAMRVRAGNGRAPYQVFRRPENTGLVALEAQLPRDAVRALRRTHAELAGDPAAASVGGTDGLVPLHGWLAVPLVGRNGDCMGWVQLSSKREGEFTLEDEAILIQLARVAAIAAENLDFSEAHEANRLKDQFLATLSHELRTPLQAMLSWASLLRHDRLDAQTVARGLEVIERSAKAQAGLIEDLLDVSRIMSNKLHLESRPVPIARVVEAALDAARPTAEAKGVALEAILDEGSVVCGDARRLQQVISNLLSNALKFTPAGGHVRVECVASQAEVEICVRDDGEGIRADLLPHVFDRFRQADSTSTRRHGGLGIGLTIVRHLVEHHGGSVSAWSAGEGLGASFCVRLPRLSDAERQRAELPVLRGDAEGCRLEGVRVLLVDDHEEARECIGLVLRQHGADVVTAGSVAEAMELLERARPDVVLSDIAMPDEDGLSLVARLRERGRREGRQLPAAALSAYARPEEVARALRAGFDLHLAKPIELSALLAGVTRLLERGRA